MSTKESKDRCVGDYPAMWRIPYRFTQDIVQSTYGTGEVERIGSQEAKEFFDVVAVTPALALAAWEKEYGHRENRKDGERFGVWRLDDPKFVCYVDAFVEVSRK
jgi:hypothetical protein